MRRSFSRGDGTGKGAGPASPLPPTRAPVEALSDKTAAESPADQATNLRLRRRWPPWCPPEREEPCPPPCPPRDPCPFPPRDLCPGGPCPPGGSPRLPWDPCPGDPCPPREPCPGDPCPPGRSPCPPWDPCPGDPCPPREPHRPGRSCQDVDLAEAFVPWQEYNGYCPPGHLEGPGTIFPELLRTPPLYAWPPGTDRRRG
jgi:hypothetical protein